MTEEEAKVLTKDEKLKAMRILYNLKLMVVVARKHLHLHGDGDKIPAMQKEIMASESYDDALEVLSKYIATDEEE